MALLILIITETPTEKNLGKKNYLLIHSGTVIIRRYVFTFKWMLHEQKSKVLFFLSNVKIKNSDCSFWPRWHDEPYTVGNMAF